MRVARFSILIISSVLLFYAQLLHGQQDLQFTVSGFENFEGVLRVNLFNTKEGFPSDFSKAYQTQVVQVNADQMRVVFKGLPSGKYAVSIFHDVNNNEELDSGLFGIPREPYGFSNNARGVFGPPKFENAEFNFPFNPSEPMVIRLKGGA